MRLHRLRMTALGPYATEQVIDFDRVAQGGLSGADADLARLAKAADPVEICESFVAYVAGVPADAAQRAVLRAVVEAAQHTDDGPGREVRAAVPATVRAGGA